MGKKITPFLFDEAEFELIRNAKINRKRGEKLKNTPCFFPLHRFTAEIAKSTEMTLRYELSGVSKLSKLLTPKISHLRWLSVFSACSAVKSTFPFCFTLFLASAQNMRLPIEKR